MSDLEEAEIWYESAKAVFGSPHGRGKYTVAVAQSIHALIKANDALTMKYLDRRSTRHEDAAVLFGDLIKQNKIDSKFADRRKLLTRVAAEKSDYDYKGAEVSKASASGWLRDAERFLEMVRGILGS
ncbi:MAG TPA: HEPN domain-containing protein [Thermoplasmata archaeon]|nr:HEPN domain-containing protein [Thermoplasmata archaeon]